MNGYLDFFFLYFLFNIYNNQEPSVFNVENYSMNNDFKQSFVNKNKELVYVPHG